MRRSLVLLAGLSLGCGAASEALTADPVDYDKFRRTRTAETSEARLRASFEYLEQVPDGRWRDQVKSWFDRAEPLYYERARDSVPALERYLGTLPDGPHGKLAAERINELRSSRRATRQRDAEVLEDALGVEQRLADADQSRKVAVRAIAEWSASLSGVTSFGKPTSELHHELIHHYRVEAPAARCADERCLKSVILSYSIPESRRLATRKMVFDVELVLYRGTVVKARLAGPELWNRLYEASERVPVRPDDAQARTYAIARAVQIVESALGTSYAPNECQREAVSPVVLARECRGVRVQMLAAPTPDVDDELVVEPIPRTIP